MVQFARLPSKYLRTSVHLGHRSGTHRMDRFPGVSGKLHTTASGKNGPMSLEFQGTRGPVMSKSPAIRWVMTPITMVTSDLGSGQPPTDHGIGRFDGSMINQY